MPEIYCPDVQWAEAIKVERSDADDCITISLRIAPDTPPDFDDTLTLLSSWWLRWIAAADCHFYCSEHTWIACCRLPPHAHRLLTPVLRDLTTIKNVVCI